MGARLLIRPCRCRRYTAGTITAAPGPTGWSLTVIRLHFPDPADSPTQRTPLRIRYAIERNESGKPVPVLHFAHGMLRLSRENWRGYRMAGAFLEAESEREQSIVREVLGDDCLLPVQE